MRLRKLLVVAGFGLISAVTAWADLTVGSPLQNYGNLDQCVGCVFPYIQFSAQDAGLKVSSYSFFDGLPQGSSGGGHILTPLLFEQTSPGTFRIIGIGATFVDPFQDTINPNIPFWSTPQGTDIVQDGNTFFGYVDGDPSGAHLNSGTISMNYPAFTGPGVYFAEPSGSLSVGESMAFTSYAASQGPRTYALQVNLTPEPGFYVLLALGLGGLAYGVRRRSQGSH